ncbi:hypothetical protein JIN85_06260 [Luteolibacter pohnpeiensis]|uniref:Uncharacterized protein n=1 Tax=Luteolibacter pohnpeiensis TaxID=454153 RepID=A0A934S2K0_9BACT|nr:hypothetical protein [Luteolibacter pohnpeiensis]MBK1882010.1 hypothetical protein [Luteolibacter pohnpeiensis]
MQIHLKKPLCPWLPEVHSREKPWKNRPKQVEKDAAFYLAALQFAQFQWLEGKPAQAILQLNKSWMADEPDPQFQPPYQALVWIMENSKRGESGFMGNPVRHFQHLASRMSGPRAEVRSWRAWVCFHLASKWLDHGYPRDGIQLAREGLWIPSWERSLWELRKSGWPAEYCYAEKAMHTSVNYRANESMSH